MVDEFCCFFEESGGYHYLFNRDTGETVVPVDLDTIHEGFSRSFSFWAPVELVEGERPLEKTYVRHWRLIQPLYLSVLRENGAHRERRRSRSGNPEEAATKLQAMLRGHALRCKLHRELHRRFRKVFDSSSTFYYFVDTVTGAASWYKPLLVDPRLLECDNGEVVEEMITARSSLAATARTMPNREFFSTQEMSQGPYYQRGGRGRVLERTSNVEIFFRRSPEKDAAARRAQDLELKPELLGATIDFLDGLKMKTVAVDDFAFVQAAWAQGMRGVHWVLTNYRERPVTRMHAFSALAQVPVDADEDAMPTDITAECITEILHCLTEVDLPYAVKSQAMLALKHIASQLPGLRALHQQNWEDVVCNTIADVKYEEVEEVVREGKGIRRVKVRFPAAGSADMVTHGCDVIGIVAQEEARREQIAAGCADVVVEAMQLFPNDALVQMAAVRALYNMCYRCEPGHRAVNKAEPEAPLHRILDRFSADFELAQLARRTLLAIGEEGWRGLVDERAQRLSFEED